MRYFEGIMNTDQSLKVDLGILWMPTSFFICDVLKMPNKCSAQGCRTNHRGMGKGTVFAFFEGW